MRLKALLLTTALAIGFAISSALWVARPMSKSNAHRADANAHILSIYLYLQQQDEIEGWSALMAEDARSQQAVWLAQYAQQKNGLEWIAPNESLERNSPLTNTDRDTIWIASHRDHAKDWVLLKHVSNGDIRFTKVSYPATNEKRSRSGFTDRTFHPTDLDRYIILGGIRF